MTGPVSLCVFGVLTLGTGLVAYRAPIMALGVLSALFPFDYPVMDKYPVTVYSTEAIIFGLFAGFCLRLIVLREKPSSGFFGCMGFLVLLSVSALISSFGALDRSAVVKQVLRWAQFWTVLAMTAHLIRDGKTVEKLFLWLAGGSAVVVLMMAAEMAGGFPYLFRLDGPFGTNAMPSYAGLVILYWLSLRREAKPVWANIVVVLLGIACVLTQSRTGNLAVLAGLLVWALLAGKAFSRGVWMAAGSIILLAIIASTISPGFRGRLFALGNPTKAVEMRTRSDIYRYGWEMWRERFVAGVGAGNYRVALEKQALKEPGIRALDSHEASSIRAHPHNFFLMVGIETGIIGLISWLAGLGWIIRRIFMAGKVKGGVGAMGFSLVVIFLITNMLDVTMIHSRGILFAIGWGVVLGAASNSMPAKHSGRKIRNTRLTGTLKIDRIK